MHPDPKPLALRTQPLTGSDLHVWSTSLNGSSEQLAYFDSLLSPEEKARAGRFYFERDRDRYITGRGILRTLLGGYLGIEASEVCIVYGLRGKPELASAHMETNLQFNLAHSNDQAAYIFGWDRPLGIDIEHVRPLADVDDLVQRFYAPDESRLIRSLSGDAKWDMFYKIWTCKEAILKAHGTGLTVPLDHFQISLDSNDAVTLSSAAEDADQLSSWHVQLIELKTGYKSAIAVKGEICKVVFQSFEI